MSVTVIQWVWTAASVLALGGTLFAIGDAYADYQAVKESGQNGRRGAFVEDQLRSWIAHAYAFTAFAFVGTTALLELRGSWSRISLWVLVSGTLVLAANVYAGLRSRHLIRKQTERRKET